MTTIMKAPVYRLREMLRTNRNQKMKRITPKTILAVTIKAFNAFARGSEVKNLRWVESSGEYFPFIDGLIPECNRDEAGA